MKKDVCPNCEKETEIETIKTTEKIRIRQDEIDINVIFSKCLECGESFENTKGYDSLEEAYREYRHRHSMTQPEEIRSWRKSYGLTQKELSTLLSWGEVTLSRYENGALQSESHEKTLRLVQEPHNLLKLIENAPHAINEEKRKRLIAELTEAEKESCSFERIYEDRFANYSPDEFSGYKKLDLEKFFNAVLFFCKEGQLKTKLNKLLFYADFKHFKENVVSITGCHYAHLQYGPVPDNFDFFYAILRSNGLLTINEALVGQYYGELYRSSSEPDLAVFSDSELKTLLEVKAFFKDYNSTNIADFSHDERGYKETHNGNDISYNYAQYLQI